MMCSIVDRSILSVNYFADEMGLGKTIQAIAACALLQHLGKAQRVLIVSPASLKSEWEEQIKQFTTLPQRLVFGSRSERAALYQDPDPAFFTICNYEQILRDSLDINANLRPDIIILAFRQDPDCRLFFSTDSGGVGLNLQNASVVINCDLPWNPAKLEQRIARAWRKNQSRPVTVINLVAEETIEHGMLASLTQKMELAAGVLDGHGELDQMTLKSGRQVFLKRLEQVMAKVPGGQTAKPAPPSDPAAHFAAQAKAQLKTRLLHCHETWLPDTDQPVLMAVLQNATAAEKPQLEKLFAATEWSGEAPTLQVLDSATWDAMEQLAASGMISIHTRAKRSLLPEAGEVLPPPLSPEQLAKIKALRETIATKRRAAEALLSAGLHEEAAPFKKAAQAAKTEIEKIENQNSAS